jgi:hypothetical protein
MSNKIQLYDLLVPIRPRVLCPEPLDSVCKQGNHPWSPNTLKSHSLFLPGNNGPTDRMKFVGCSTTRSSISRRASESAKSFAHADSPSVWLPYVEVEANHKKEGIKPNKVPEEVEFSYKIASSVTGNTGQLVIHVRRIEGRRRCCTELDAHHRPSGVQVPGAVGVALPWKQGPLRSCHDFERRCLGCFTGQVS